MIVLAKDLTLSGPRFDTKFTAATQKPKLWEKGFFSGKMFHNIDSTADQTKYMIL